MLVVTGDCDAAEENVTVSPDAKPAPLKVASKLTGVNAVLWLPSPSVTPMANPGKMPSEVKSGELAAIVITVSETRVAVDGLPLKDESKRKKRHRCHGHIY